jgi:hypothetical protein
VSDVSVEEFDNLVANVESLERVISGGTVSAFGSRFSP